MRSMLTETDFAAMAATRAATMSVVLKDIKAGKYRDQYLIANRKSTDEPNIQRNSIAYQKAENMKFAVREKLPIAPLTLDGFCRDGIVSERHSAFKEDYELRFSGDNMVQYRVKRPKFFRLVQWLSERRFKGVIFLCWDRASRNKADDVLIRKLIKAGVEIRFALAHYDKTSSGELHMDVEGMFAAHHSRVTSEKVTLTFRNSRERGLWTHKAGVGYLNEGGMEHKPKDPERAPLILRFAQLVDEGSSLAGVARWAILQGFTMPPMRRRRTEEEKLADDEEDEPINIEPTSRLPTANSIHKILTNRFYTGKILTTDGKWIPSNSHEAIIPEELFNRVQERLQQKNKSMHYVNVLDHPCRGMFRCGVCGRVYTPYPQKGILYFGAKCLKDCANPKKSFNLEFITGEVGKLMERLAFTDEEKERIDAKTSTDIALLETKRLNQLDENDRKKKNVRESLAYLNANRLDLLKTGAYTPETIVAEEMKLDFELAALQDAETTSDVAMRETVREVVILSELAKEGSRYYSIANPKEKERIIRVFFSELIVNGETLEYKCKNGFKTLESRFAPTYDLTGNRTPINGLRSRRPNR